MKKKYILCIMLAVFAIMTSCKKDQDFVTLRAVIDQPTKVFINGDRYPCWNEGDKVYVNSNSYTLQNISNTTAEIPDVASTENGFRAIYPASLVASGTDISSATTVSVTLSNKQYYRTFEDENNSNAITQKVELPMGAHTANGNTLVFHNLCSVIRLDLTNILGQNQNMEINKITIKAQNLNSNQTTYLSGTGTATINNDEDDDKIVLTSGSNEVSLFCGGVSLARNQNRTFDIFVPEFSTSDVTITVETANGFVEATAPGVSLGHNKIVTLTQSISNLIPYPATLLYGPDFNSQAAAAAGALSNIHHVVFEYGSSTTSNYEFQSTTSQTPIYGTFSNGTLTLSTSAEKIRADKNCQEMFKNFTSLEETPDFDGLTSTKTAGGNYGDHFIAEGVTSMYEMFMGCTSLTSFNLGVFANTYALKNMGEMFSGCTSLVGVTNTGVSGNSTFTTENVTSMQHLFGDCTSLASIAALSSFNTEKVTEMNAMFYHCRALQSINLSNFNTGRVNNMESMFQGCSNANLTSLDLSSFNTESVSSDKSMKCMFEGCSGLRTITLPSNTNIKRVQTMEKMFYGCTNLVTINNFTAFFNNEDNGVNNVLWTTEGMFQNCNNLTTIVFPTTFKTNNVRIMKTMFYGCRNLTTLDISSFTTSRTDQGIDMESMFDGCQQLSSITFNSNFTGGHVTNMKKMFYNCNALTILDLSSFNTTYVTNMSDMFNECWSLSTLDLHPDFTMTGVEGGLTAHTSYFGRMFRNLGTNVSGCTITCTQAVKEFFEKDKDGRLRSSHGGYPGEKNNAKTPNNTTFSVPTSK